MPCLQALLPRRRQHVRSGEGARQSGSPEFVHLLSPRFMSSGSGTFLRVIDRPVAGRTHNRGGGELQHAWQRQQRRGGSVSGEAGGRCGERK